MATSFNFDFDKSALEAPKLFSSAFKLSRRENDSAENTSKNNNMADEIARSLEQGSKKSDDIGRNFDYEKWHSIKSESKSKRKSFSIRSLLDQDLKSPSDSGYGSGSPSPHEHVLCPGTSCELEEKLESQLKLSQSCKKSNSFFKPSENSHSKNCETPEKCSQLPRISSPLPVNYRDLLFAMNARFLQKDDSARKINETFLLSSSTNFSPRKQLMEHCPNEENNTNIKGDYLRPSNQSASSQFWFSPKELNAKSANQNKVQAKKTKFSKTDLNLPKPDEAHSQLWTAEFSETPTKNNLKTTGNISNFLLPQQEYFQQLNRFWWENVKKNAENFANQAHNHQLAFPPTYLQRLQMYFAATAAATSGNHFSSFSPPPYLSTLNRDNMQSYIPSATFPSSILKRNSDLKSK